MANTAKFFTTKKSRSGGTMLFLRGRQIGSIFFDKATKAYSFAAKEWHDFSTFEQAELFAWLNHNTWLGET